MTNCLHCDQSLTRQAALALALRKLGVALHKGHAGHWEQCQEPLCLQASTALHTAGFDVPGARSTKAAS